MLEWIQKVQAFLQEGGFVMWPLAGSALVLWYILGYRWWTLRRGSWMPLSRWIAQCQHADPSSSCSKGAFAEGQVVAARQVLALGLVGAAIARGWHAFQVLGTEGKPQYMVQQLEDSFFALRQEGHRFGLGVQVIAVVAPLVGLLGTVSVMIETSNALGDMSLYSQSVGIAGGISQALLTTQMGLAVAIPALLFGQILQCKQDALLLEVEQVQTWFLEYAHAQHTGVQFQERVFHQHSDQEQDGGKQMRRARRQGSEGPQIDISPLIDMVFILLIFFMVSTTFVKDMKLELERPAASSSTRASTKAVRIHLDRSGALFLDGAAVKHWMLQSRVRQLLKDDRARPVLVITDRLVRAEKLIEVVDQCRLAGAKDVGVATQQEAG
ncbi:MAG: biopolymer transporter ExbD [Myxococcota bacterium]